MGKVLKLLRLGFIAILIVALLVGCVDESPTTDETDDGGGVQAEAAADSPVATPTPIPLPDDLRIGFVGNNRVELNHPLPVTVNLVGNQVIEEISLRAQLPMMYLQVQDVNPDTEEIIEIVAEIPEDKVLRNEVDETGVLYFDARDINLPGHGGRIDLCTIPLQGIALGQEDINLYSATLKSSQGEDLVVSLPEPFVIIVQEDPVVTTPTPTPSPSPKPTETSPPEATPTPSTMPTSSWTPAPLPPLSEVITTPIPIQPNSVYYRIHPKQTIYRLSEMFGTTVEAIVEANDIKDVNAVEAGAVLRIPVAPPAGKAAYFVSTKETLYSTAKAFGLTVEALVAMNDIKASSYDDIEIGEWLVLLPED